MENELAAGCSSIHVFLQTLETDAFLTEIGDGSNEVFERTTEPVKPQTTKVSPALRWSKASCKPGRSAFAPLVVSVKIFRTQPA